jgi:hypothetical protein
VLSWAYLNSDYEAILDDRAARNYASSLGIRVWGTIGIILLAKKERALPEAPWGLRRTRRLKADRCAGGSSTV